MNLSSFVLQIKSPTKLWNTFCRKINLILQSTHPPAWIPTHPDDLISKATKTRCAHSKSCTPNLKISCFRNFISTMLPAGLMRFQTVDKNCAGFELAWWPDRKTNLQFKWLFRTYPRITCKINDSSCCCFCWLVIGLALFIM